MSKSPATAAEMKTESGPRRAHWLFASLRGLEMRALPADLIAGLTLAAIALPAQLATAHLAGMTAETGLFAFAAGAIAFAIFGANRFMSVGADSTIAPIFAGSLSLLAATGTPAYAAYAGLLALMVGTILIVAGIVRAGWIADMLSIPVTTGFLAGISIHIVVGQLPVILGIASPDGNLVERLWAILRDIPQANGATTIIGLLVFVVTFGAGKLSARIPGALIGLVGAALATWQLGLAEHGVKTLGPLSTALPAIVVPAIAFDDLPQLLPLAFTIALICMMQMAVVVRAFPSDPDALEDIGGDFIGLGAGNVLAAFLGAFAVNASPPNTTAIAESGGRSQLTGLTAVVAIAVLVAAAGAAFGYVPEAALAGVLVFLSVRIFRVTEMMSIARRGDSEIFLVVASAALVALLPVDRGVLLAILLSLGHSTYQLARPKCTRLVRLPNTTIWWSPSRNQPSETVAGVLVFAPAAPLTFINASFVRAQFDKALAETQDTRLVVIEASGITQIDYTGALGLIGTITRLRKRGIDVALARLEADRAAAAAGRSGLLETLGPGHVFHSVEEAVRTLAPDGKA
jgi:MFS superfamily sulfate permease-like transporter